MNKENAVIVDQSASRKEWAKKHLSELELKTHEMSAEEHDTFIQQSQLPLFTLLPLLPHLSKWADQGVLTPSGKDLMQVLQKRDRSWTPATKQSLQEHSSLL